MHIIIIINLRFYRERNSLKESDKFKNVWLIQLKKSCKIKYQISQLLNLKITYLKWLFNVSTKKESKSFEPVF